MTNEPGEKNNSFADPAPKLRVKKGSDGDLIDGGATGQGAEESCRHDHADSVVAPYVPPEVGSADGESVVAPFVPLAAKVKADHAKIHPQSGLTHQHLVRIV
jgi:hypothetical protein